MRSSYAVQRASPPAPATLSLLGPSPDDAPMESGLAAVPRYAAGPLRVAPLRALSLAPRRVGDPASARAFARPYRGVPQRLETWRKRGLATRDEQPSLYLHE